MRYYFKVLKKTLSPPYFSINECYELKVIPFGFIIISVPIGSNILKKLYEFYAEMDLYISCDMPKPEIITNSKVSSKKKFLEFKETNPELFI